MDEHSEIIALLKEIQANQQSLHDDIAVVVERLTQLEQSINVLTQHASEPPAIDEHQLYVAARSLVVETGRASTSMLQRVLRIGYSRAASLIDALEENKVISPQDGARPRAVLIDVSVLESIEEEEENGSLITGDDDELYEEAKAFVLEAGKCSTSYLQRKLRIGYSRAAFLVQLLEKNGVVGPANGAKPREVHNHE